MPKIAPTIALHLASSPLIPIPCILVTGFEPFGGESVNPSWRVACALEAQVLAGHRVVAAQLPTCFGTSADQLKTLLRKHRPALVLCLGQAGGRSAISLERIAINVDDARIADNAGYQPIDCPVRAKGPAAYWSTLPIKAMALALQQAGIAAQVSQTAGTFVCNHVFYALMHALRGKAYAGVRGGFVHIPFASAQCVEANLGQPCMPLEEMVRGVRLALECALNNAKDIKMEAGAEH
jgi:pyroglutamyl-peptidase